MAKKLTLEAFLFRAKKIHGDLYDYSCVLYKNMHTKVKIIDPEFGEFFQTPMAHIQNKQGHRLRGFKNAANKRKMTLDDFIKEANIRHQNLYDYSKVIYENCDKKVCIIDPIYGEFWQTPYNHLRNHGCPERTKHKEWLVDIDHKIPLSIICNQRFLLGHKWAKERPLYKFLNSKINLESVSATYNTKKSDTIIVNGISLSASSVRNNYDVIEYLCKTLLNFDATDIIEEDKKFINNFLFDK